MWYRCNALPTELTSQQRTSHWKDDETMSIYQNIYRNSRIMAVMDKTSDWSNRLDPPTIKHLTDNDSPYPCLVMTRSLALIRCVFPAASLNIIFEKSQRPILALNVPPVSPSSSVVSNRLGVVSWCSGWLWSLNDVIEKTKMTPKTPVLRKPRST